jgi:pre-mRNA-splicing helicase BRR2
VDVDSEEDEKSDADEEEVEDDDEEKMIQGGAGGKKKSSGGSRVLSVHEIDAHFLQRRLAAATEDADAAECAKLADEILAVLDVRGGSSIRECENQLLVLLGFERFDFIKMLLSNRVRIWGCVSIKRATDEQTRDAVEKSLEEEETGEGRSTLEELRSRSMAEDWKGERMRNVRDDTLRRKDSRDKADEEEGDGANKMSKALDSIQVRSKEDDDVAMEDAPDSSKAAHELDLESLAFRDGNHTMTNKKCDLPDKSWRAMKPGYEEVHVPAVRSVAPPGEKLVPIEELPEWTHDAFKGMKSLNRVQSKMAEVALKSSENILLCAPTGAGKTNVAMLSILNVLGQYRKEDADEVEEGGEKQSKHEGMFDLSAFKIIYVAPMKALVQEVVKNFSKRLAPYGITVRELSGDSSLTRQQIAETQMIVTTPEKWDIVTRQGEGRAYTQLVRLVIIDEIHLLHDDRGPVLESIVARVIRQVETTAEPVRLVGLSATLPNYADVATFLRVKPEKGMFFFDHSYRPVPLQMQYIGITERKFLKT